ncbi:type II methionyl aminopeptidase [Hyperthermus butylicus]|uniref:Methionine aminopeptidase n=1 Tax=Hyperthermus butylicus (strain DSM 5456 / JCM 9403 / PLM1-5) TaxID=415426 RepID=A2BL73_HYPBU|nr:type II methionyl aminopeptidase [Hyperthermus butylicus]ABM80734.1 Methionine aminopeptidase [Hyperthermus butylicus DSM 5456]
MEEEALKAYLEAGRIARQVLEEASRRVEPGLSVLEFCEWVENRIRELGGQPAFPCNIGVSHIAAHYTPTLDDTSTIPEDSVVKIDVGVHVDGYIADTATTIDLTGGKYARLLEAVREALEKALKTVKPGAKFSDVSKTIETIISSYGFKPVANLGGHSIARYRVHAGESIPNIYEPFARGRFQPSHVYAIEPFGTNGAGVVEEGELVTIYSLSKPNLKRRLDDTTRNILEEVKKRFKTLPFTERWLRDVASVDQLRQSLRKLSRMGFLTKYPILVEKRRGIVAQFEHTVLIRDDGEVIITTA